MSRNVKLNNIELKTNVDLTILKKQYNAVQNNNQRRQDYLKYQERKNQELLGTCVVTSVAICEVTSVAISQGYLNLLHQGSEGSFQ
jgi:hypothetical protein